VNAPVFDYMLFGLRIRSELELPELSSAQDHIEPDVWVRSATIPADPAPAGLSVHDGALMLTVDDVGRYRIASGSEIVVDPKPGVDPRNVRLFLLGSAFGALLHQRGLLPLHANAVEIEGKAVAFMGPSGAGKSTLAAWFHDQGYRVIADDVCVVSWDGHGSRVSPGLPRLRLWAEAITATRRDANEFERSYAGDSPYEKYDVPLDLAVTGSSPLAAVYVLARAERHRIEPLAGSAAAEAIFANTYRGAFVEAAGQHVPHWSASMALLRSTPVFAVERRWGFDVFEAELAAILRHAREVVNSLG
jgi:hypothetical protein